MASEGRPAAVTAASAASGNGADRAVHGGDSCDADVIRRSWHDPEHFAVLFRKYAPEIQRYVTRRIGAAEAEDVVAETFLAAFGQRESYDLAHPYARPWLYGIATNLTGRRRRTEIRMYRALARTGRDPVTEPFTDRVDAAAAAAGPAVSPGQWIYRQRLDRMLGHRMLCLSPGQPPVSGTCPSGIQTSEGWSTADGTRNASFYRGKLITEGGPPAPIRYADLGSLPRDPVAIVADIARKWAYPKTGGGPASAAFQGIFALLGNYVLPPAVAAELYRALADIPGVTVNPHATDLAGRHGPAFTLKVRDGPGYDVFELILNPRAYTLMGFTEATHGVTTRDRHVHLVFESEVAIVRQMPVSGPGQRP